MKGLSCILSDITQIPDRVIIRFCIPLLQHGNVDAVVENLKLMWLLDMNIIQSTHIVESRANPQEQKGAHIMESGNKNERDDLSMKTMLQGQHMNKSMKNLQLPHSQPGSIVINQQVGGLGRQLGQDVRSGQGKECLLELGWGQHRKGNRGGGFQVKWRDN